MGRSAPCDCARRCRSCGRHRRRRTLNAASATSPPPTAQPTAPTATSSCRSRPPRFRPADLFRAGHGRGDGPARRIERRRRNRASGRTARDGRHRARPWRTRPRASRRAVPHRIELYSLSGGRITLDQVTTDLSPLPRLDAAGNLSFRFGGRLLVTGDADGQYPRRPADHRRISLNLRRIGANPKRALTMSLSEAVSGSG